MSHGWQQPRASGSPDTVHPDDLLADDPSRISSTALVRQAVTTIVVTALGIGAFAAVSAVSAPYDPVSTTASRLVSGTDRTRAVPALVVVAEAAVTGATDIGTSLTHNSDLATTPLRLELATAMSDALAERRNTSLDKTRTEVEASVSTALVESRSNHLNDQVNAITAENDRIAAAKAAAEKAAAEKEAARKAAAAVIAGQVAKTKGSLTRQAVPAATSSVVDAALTGTSTGFITPLAPGSYVRGAGWGATGSWSRYHTGVDLSAPGGTPIRAVTSGVVMASTGGGWAGTHVIIRHAGGGQTLYAHMSSKAVSPGQIVQPGQVIGTVGMTGRAFGYHLHFEYYPAGTTPGDVYSSADPVSWMLRNGIRL